MLVMVVKTVTARQILETICQHFSQPGPHLKVPVLQTTMLTTVEFFRLFFLLDLIKQIVAHTNAYVWNKFGQKQHYVQSDRSCRETCPNEIEKLIALIIYFGSVNVSTTHRFWSLKTLYHGLCARKIFSRERYKTLMAVLHIVHPNAEDSSDKLRKVSSFVSLIIQKEVQIALPAISADCY